MTRCMNGLRDRWACVKVEQSLTWWYCLSCWYQIRSDIWYQIRTDTPRGNV